VIYQVYIRSFADGDGDGIGDLAGIRARLPYLRTLGVDALWVTPFYPSPMADGGYDVADYRDIEPLFGTLGEADKLILEAHEHGLRLVVDIVPNHTSDQHAWFLAALAAAPGSPERARYWFRDGKGPDGSQPPNDWQSTFGGPAWERVPDGQWYLHLFAPEQPDLNWDNPEVREEFLSVLRFWLDRGADGFRIDVAHGLVKDPALPDLGPATEDILQPTTRTDHPFWDRDGVLEIYEEWRRVLDSYDGERMLVGEAWVSSPRRLARYVAPGRLHTSFNFDFVKAPWLADRLHAVIDSCLAACAEVGAPATWVLSNHDIVRHVTRYGRSQPGDGYRDEEEMEALEPVDLALGRRRARAAALLMLALPGGAYVYQGEELGLEEVEDLPEELLQDPVWKRTNHQRRGRDGCRVPLPWSGSSPPFRFGPDGSSAAWLPAPGSWAALTAAAQDGDAASVLSLYREALALRRESPALGNGGMQWVESPAGTLVFTREPGFACAVNLDAEPLDVGALGLGEPVLCSGPLDPDGALPADTAAWFRRPWPPARPLACPPRPRGLVRAVG